MCLRCVADSSIRVFIREVNSLRLLIINGAIPVVIVSTYRALMSVFMSYVSQEVPLSSYNVRPILMSSVSFVDGVVWFVTIASLVISLVTSIFIIGGLVRGWRDELRAINNIFRARAGVLVHVLVVLTLATLYSYILGTSISVVLSLVILKVLSSLGILPLINYSIGVLGIIHSSLPLLPTLLVTYLLIGVFRVLRYDFIP